MDLKYILNEAGYYKKLGGLSRAIRKFIFSQTPLRKAVNTRPYNLIYSRIMKRKLKNYQPRVLQIENTNFCNAQCIMCPHTIMKRKTKVMKFDDFKKIVNNVMESYDIERLTINGFGEPLIDRNLVEKISYVNSRYPQVKIDIYTNASLLTRETSNKILNLKVDRITFSINGTEKNYGRIMKMDYKNTEKNVLYFLKENSKSGKILTNVSLVVLEENEKDIKEFIEFWRTKADSVRVYAPSDWAGNLKTENVLKIERFGKRWPCFTLWNNITIDVDGNVIMCCRDYESKERFGNLLKKGIKEIRNSKKFRALQENHKKFNFSMPICNKCENSFDSSLDWWD